MMKKIISLLLVFVLTFTVIPTAAFALAANTRGNTAGNLHNDGYAAIQGDWIYYVNNDNRIPGIFSTDFYKMRIDGTKVTKLDQGLTVSSEINIAGDWIYYRGWGGYLYKAKPDDSAATRLTDYSVEHIQVVDDWIYFSKRAIGGCAEHNLYRIRTDGTDEQMLADSEDDKRTDVNIAGDWIYYSNASDGFKLYKIRKYILSPAGNSYYHNIRASGSGTMDYIIRDYSPLAIGNSVIKSFENVSLTIGKQMTANIGGTIKPSEVQFYIIDENGKNIGSIEGETTVLDRYDASDWARNGIKEAIEKGFVPPDLQNNYKSVITRQEFCRMAVRWVEYKTGKSIEAVMQEKGVSRDPNAFTDTNDPDILAAYALGITNGTGNKRFTPNGQFNREQAAAMIRNTCKVVGMDISNVSSAGFADIGTASGWAVDGINFVRNAGIMQGTGNNKFDPKSTYTREQSILTFNNILFISEADLEAFANEVFLLTNIEREKAGLAVFRQSSSLTKTAKIRANELISSFSHDRPDGRDCFTAFKENGVDYGAAGENIAMGQRSPKQVVDGWMNSPGHKANILDSGYGHLGVGVAVDGNGTLYWVQNFTD